MKKNTTKKNPKTKAAKTAPVAVSSATISYAKECKPCYNPWSIYIYWFIILFFIAATFYILGRSHGPLHNVNTPANTDVVEETLMAPSDYYNTGRTKLMAGNIDDAIADLTTAINSGVATADIYVLRGDVYMQQSNYIAALADFDAAIAADSMNANAYYERSLLNTRLEDYSAALSDINNALAASVSRPESGLSLRDLYARRGQLNLWLKNWQGAIADYTNSLARPDGTVSADVYAGRAEAYTAMGSLADAIADYSAAIRVISEQMQGLDTVAARESLSSNAMAYFEKSAALNLAMGNMDAAREDLGSAMAIAASLNDEETVNRLNGLIAEMDQ